MSTPASASAPSASARRSSAFPDDKSVKIKIVQQPLHARMCGFGEKDRRPVDPPPIVQLLLDEEHEQHPTKRLQRSAAASAAAAKKALLSSSSSSSKSSKPTSKGRGKGRDHEEADEDSVGDDEEDETYQLDDEDEEDENDHDNKNGRPSRRGPTSGGRSATTAAPRGRAGSLKQESVASLSGQNTSSAGSSPSLGKRGRPSTRSRKTAKRSGATSDHDNEDKDEGVSHSDRSHSGGSGDEYESSHHHHHHHHALEEQDPLFVLHVSLWSADGKEVRNMIATPGQSEPPKLTRILMGSLVVSPILLNNPEGVPGWYFSFPDLSIRTEGIYTLKFSLMRFGSFDFMSSENGHASMLVAEEVSEPFTVFSAKKFPGMTESTELSKAFAKQGLKIPIRNDLRARRVDRD
ncbi:hypothetical protein EDD11_001016 [Mortierella claussenii]|nr:hypothetical protein EDD11_001016 [Mortierella claussenii]